jgi:hypothetical protein
MHRLHRCRLLGLCLMLGLGLTACGTTSAKQRRQDRKELKYNTSQKVGKPKNFGIYKKREIDRRWLKRGKRAMYAPALDSY